MAHAVNVLTAEVRRPASSWRPPPRQCREPGAKDGQRQPGDAGAGCAVGDEVEQRPKVTEIGATGVVGAAALQREVLVELLEHRLEPRVATLLPAGFHVLTVADDAAAVQVTRRSVSGVSSVNDL